jgi:excisionase family DNA binding protein
MAGGVKMKYYSPEEIAEMYSLKPGTVRKWIREGKLKAVKLGALWRISEEERQRFIKAGQGEDLSRWTESEKERRREVEAGRAVVANIKTDNNLITWAKEKGLFVKIARPSKWGNPDNSKVTKENRQAVCESFIKHYNESPKLQQSIKELKGKVLSCWCYPEQCHGDYLAEQANKK